MYQTRSTMKGRSNCPGPSWLSSSFPQLEVQTQSELHTAEGAVAEALDIDAEPRIGQCIAKAVVVVRTGIHTRCVGDVVDLPGKLQPCAFAQTPTLAQCRV